ncbi:hypothetical protein HID58_043384, partial [Brassica napus]
MSVSTFKGIISIGEGTEVKIINKTLQDFSDDILALKPSKTGARDSYICEIRIAAPIATQEPDLDSGLLPRLLQLVHINISSSICLAPCGIPGDLFSWVCWNLWIARNKLFFKARLAFVQTTATKTLAGAIEWTHAQDPHVATPKNTLIPVRPQLIPVGTVTCNTDANWKKKTSV